MSNRLAKLQAYARPIAMYAMIWAFLAITLVVVYLLVSEKTSLDAASSILVTIVGVIAPIMTAMVAGRSWEKVSGVVEDVTQPTPMNMEMEDEYHASDDPMEDIRRMDLDEYRSKRPNDLAVD